jgi:hypothetical protein
MKIEKKIRLHCRNSKSMKPVLNEPILNKQIHLVGVEKNINRFRYHRPFDEDEFLVPTISHWFHYIQQNEIV